MQRDEPRPTPIPAAPVALRPELERTLIAFGWTSEELRSPLRSPLANLQVVDLRTSLVARWTPPSPPRRGEGRGTAAKKLDDPNDIRMASEWSWMDALAAMSWADPQSTMVTPSRRRAMPHSPRRDLEPTRMAPQAPQALREALGAQTIPAAPETQAEAPAEPEAPPQPSPELPPLPPVPERPALMPGVQLLGTMPDTGFAEQQWLAQRGETFMQLSELLYRVLEQVDGRRSLEEIAALARETTGRPVSANNVRLLIAARLLPLGLVVPVDGVPVEQPGDRAPRSPLAVTLRLGFLRAEWIELVARVLQVFFWPPVLAPLALLIAVGQLWLYLAHGIATPLAAALAQPLALLGISSFIFLSAVFHEFGHASALRYGGGRARGIGFGVYFIYPAFYTDCTESYRLGRWGRLRTDLGGVYFDLITTLGLTLAYIATHQELLLAAVVLLDLEIFDQFNPIVRFDGYWALADLIGVPDFFTLMGPTLRGVVSTFLRRRQPGAPSGAMPTRPTTAMPGSQAPALKGWVKVAFLVYTAVAVPFLVVFLGLLLANVPGLLGATVDSLAERLVAALAAAHAGARFALILSGTQIVILLGTALLLLYGIGNILRGLVRSLWRWGEKTGRRRALSMLALAGGLALLVVLWQPQLAVLVPHFAQVVSYILHGS